MNGNLYLNKKYKVPTPQNEAGVVLLFGACFSDFKFSDVSMQAKYPDATAYSYVLSRKVSIELEYASLNFIKHNHDINEIDFIVCWSHDAWWIEKPVVELRSGNIYIYDGLSSIRIYDLVAGDIQEIKDFLKNMKKV